jgi:hypothetical protein
MLKSNNILSHSKLPLMISNISIGGRLRKTDSAEHVGSSGT